MFDIVVHMISIFSINIKIIKYIYIIFVIKYIDIYTTNILLK